jgi:hypothetical protein
MPQTPAASVHSALAGFGCRSDCGEFDRNGHRICPLLVGAVLRSIDGKPDRDRPHPDWHVPEHERFAAPSEQQGRRHRIGDRLRNIEYGGCQHRRPIWRTLPSPARHRSVNADARHVRRTQVPRQRHSDGSLNLNNSFL